MFNKEEIERAIAVLASLNISQQQPAKASDSGALGFCDPPAGGDAIYVNDEKGAFYRFNLETKEQELLDKKALKCKVLGLRFVTKEYDGDESVKLRVDLMADRPIMLEKALSTNFTRGLIFGLARLGELVKEPITIEVYQPQNLDKKTSFCNLYDFNNQRVTDKSSYINKEATEKLEALGAELSGFLDNRRKLGKKQVQEKADLQAKEEEILVQLVEQISQNL